MTGIEFEILDSGEVLISKGADAAEREQIEAAITRAAALMKNDDEISVGPEGKDAESEAADQDETAEEREARLRRERRRLAANEQTVAEGRRVAATSPFRERTEKRGTMPSLDDAIQTVAKSGLTFPTLERFVKAARGELTEHMVTKLLLETWGAGNFAKNLQASTREGQIARAALQKAKHAAWGIA